MKENDKIQFVEKRAFQRFLLDKDVYSFTHAGKILGLIKDISTGGMTVQYVVLNERQPIDTLFDLVDIFMIGGHFVVRDTPCRIIYDRRCPREDHSFGLVETRRMGIQFGRLSADRQAAIKTLIETCALRVAPENTGPELA
ncbi:PilZ domain-containing protein [Desulfatiglans anilini]|uniref:PilZ domain-containing protein n=1 Tax=Desulfatiglans anilini TaxID=90728 RepID=UPI000486CCA8|nr:PilZ domain-containing protein [Desulfatiglans anilini]